MDSKIFQTVNVNMKLLKQIKKEWEGLASPEIEYMDKYWQFGDSMNEISVMKLRKDFEEKYDTSMPHLQFA